MNIVVSVKLCVSADTQHPKAVPQTLSVLLLRLCVTLLISHGSASITLPPSEIESIGSRLLHSGLVSTSRGDARQHGQQCVNLRLIHISQAHAEHNFGGGLDDVTVQCGSGYAAGAGFRRVVRSWQDDASIIFALKKRCWLLISNRTNKV